MIRGAAISGSIDPLYCIKFIDCKQGVKVGEGSGSIKVVEIILHMLHLLDKRIQKNILEHSIGDHAGEIVRRDVPFSI